MIPLTTAQVLFLHARLVEETGGSHGVRDLGLVQSAVARPLASFGGEDLYPSLIDKAAALLESLIGNHPFIDGNKRTGVAAAGLFLDRNGRRLTATNEELEAFAVAVAEGRVSLDESEAWLESHSRLIEFDHDENG
ncbi:MAG: type II toxin-antitoxin system death-on-curing family toxin [Gemmatimonadota bacterium]